MSFGFLDLLASAQARFKTAVAWVARVVTANMVEIVAAFFCVVAKARRVRFKFD
jgi:hypothetical protein